MNAALVKALRDFAEDIRQVDRPIACGDHEKAQHLVLTLACIVEGQSVERAFGAPGEWGYHTPIGEGVYAMLTERKPDDGRPRWHYAADQLPDDEIRVLIAVNCGGEEEADFGYHAEGKWWFDGPPHLSPVEAHVYAWAELTMLPIRKDGAS